jgi:RNA polymerase sigma-70 factor (ECF subfamily)
LAPAEDYLERNQRAVERTALEESKSGASQERYIHLLDEFGSGLSRLAAAYEAVPQAREDLLQDIRVALWVALPKFRGQASLRTFVYRIAHNRALTHVWRRKQAGTPDPIEDLQLVDARPGPEASAMESASRDQLFGAIRGLPIASRQVMTLALEDMSNREIAAILGLTENNVAVRLTRARTLLRARLGRSK